MLKSLLENYSIWIHPVIFRNLTISKIVKNFEFFFKKTGLLCNQFVIEGLACFRLSYGNFKQNPVARSLSCKLFSTDWSMFFTGSDLMMARVSFSVESVTTTSLWTLEAQITKQNAATYSRYFIFWLRCLQKFKYSCFSITIIFVET